MKIVLISCVSKKRSIKTSAEEMYISPWFKLALKYAKSLNHDRIFILSAKYGLLNLKDEIEPYNLFLNKLKSYEVEQWARGVLDDLSKETDLQNDEFIFLAGEKYRKFLIPKIKNYFVPMKGLGIGRQLRWLKQKT